MKRLRNLPFTQHIIDAYKAENVYVIISSFQQEASYSQYLYISKTYMEESRSVMRMILQSLVHIHSCGIIHRDVKMGNILYDHRKKTACLIDYDLSTFERKGGHTSNIGTVGFIAPEILKGLNYHKSIDIYSLGVVFGALLHKKK